MSRHDDEPGQGHMLDHALEAVEMTRGKTRGDLDTDRQLNLALVRLLEIVGEAAVGVCQLSSFGMPGIQRVFSE